MFSRGQRITVLTGKEAELFIEKIATTPHPYRLSDTSSRACRACSGGDGVCAYHASKHRHTLRRLEALANHGRQRREDERVREQCALYRQYCLVAVLRHVQQFTGVTISGSQAQTIVEMIADRLGMGPITEYPL